MSPRLSQLESLVSPAHFPEQRCTRHPAKHRPTDALSLPGSYTCQIFWKGDPGIENFVIKFTTEELMKKWASQVDVQRRSWKEKARGSNKFGTSETEFTFMQNQGALENPYRYEDDGEDDDDVETVAGYPPSSEFSAGSRTGSRSSLRSRSTTGDSGPPPAQSAGRVPPPRFPMGVNGPALTLRTQQLAGTAPSPGERVGESYFSPSIDSPVSSRTSSSSNMFPFPRQQPPTSAYHGEDSNRFTAPAIGRTASRDGQGPNGFVQSSRAQRPSAPPTSSSQSAQNRFRSASSPDIQNPLAPNRRYVNNVPDVPVPPFPIHYAHHPGLNRSQSNSPTGAAAGRMPAQAQGNAPRDRSQPARHAQEPTYQAYEDAGGRQPGFARGQAPMQQDGRPLSPRSEDGAAPGPTQLKVKVQCPQAGATYTLVVAINISYQSLKDRIDAKLQRSTNLSLSSNQLKLKYLDEDDYVSIQSDEDVQIAFETWKEQHMDQIVAGQLGEIELYCQ
jgi:cell division control protein 24